MGKGLYTLCKGRVDLVAILCVLEEDFDSLFQSSGVSLGMPSHGREVAGHCLSTIR